jgi:two-component system, OmpR family, sensor histidine kinase MprB
VNELTQALSFMAASVIESRNRQRRLVDDAAHELRTPLTSLRTNLQLLRQSVVQQRALTEADVAAALDDSLAESAELGDLTEELVALAATGGEHGSSWQQERVDALQLVREVAFRAKRRSGRTIEVFAKTAVCDVDAVRPRLERALANIIGNATKFAPEGAVRVSVSADADSVQIAVEDSGPGIAPEDRAQVTERFWRSPTTRGLPGSGLGLAIVSDVAIECGGQLDIAQSRDLGGARIVLSLPRASADSTEIS